MSKKNVEAPASPNAENADVQVVTKARPVPVLPIALSALALIVCTLVSAAPLLHMAGKAFLETLPTNRFLLFWGNWLPNDLHLAQVYWPSMYTTNAIEFLLLMALTFGIYAGSAFFVHRQSEDGDYRAIVSIIWLSTMMLGLIYVLIPAMLSRDIFVYVGYGRTLVTHQANPYFVTPSAFPQDPLTAYDDWKNAVSAYGPLWLAICSSWTLLIGTSPLKYVLAFRLFALAAHLVNACLVAMILKKMGYSSRTVALGTLLYAWNPLALMESSLGGHNDVLMVTLILSGILLCIRAEQKCFVRPVHYLPPAITFTLATLVKFTAAPVLAFYLILLAYSTLYPKAAETLMKPSKRESNWRPALLKVLLTSAVSMLVALGLYAPFWIGHSIANIVQSFSSPPSSYFSENSLLRVIYENIKAHGLPAQNSWAYLPLSIFSQHSVWNIINLVTLLATLLLGAIWLWRVPTTRTLILAFLMTLSALLIVTPWFFPWYVSWLVGLAAICTANDSKGRALIAFALTFSATALIIYLYHGVPPIGNWNIAGWAGMIGIPVLVFLAVLRQRNKHALADNSALIT
ncbi:MAG: hypothetical protein NVS4B7_07810 [Ktedonobacteraceae bacterium]